MTFLGSWKGGLDFFCRIKNWGKYFFRSLKCGGQAFFEFEKVGAVAFFVTGEIWGRIDVLEGENP